ncbi:MAG TPA: DUF455 family protein [Bacteriovoracaceae bacterium]|nr:DUF455 family protein [Bacteriovoracaceae bacterium]
MTSYHDFSRQILEGQNLDDKLLSTPLDWEDHKNFSLPARPGRCDRLRFSDKVQKFPRASSLSQTDKKAMALHSFANHELLAIEMMAAALLIYPHQSDDQLRFKKGVLTSLKDEQKHLRLYIGRIEELGYQFGDFPLNDYFWRQMPKLETPAQYAAVMALTFEAANLDFAGYYADVFRSSGDLRTAALMDVVLEDEISHVALGANWMKKWRGDKGLWEYYRECLPHPMTPARARGIYYRPEVHQAAMSDESFVQSLSSYEDDFLITKRARA